MMKTRHWVLIFASLAIICAVLTVYFFLGINASERAYVYSDGSLVMTLPLDENAQYTVSFKNEWNMITVKDGKIAVTASSCSSQDCVSHGFSNGGAPIVCLPNRLIIEFSTETAYDAMIG